MDCTIDYETRSTVKLKNRGAYVYASHPDTSIMCLSFGVDDEKPKVWIPDYFMDRINPGNILFRIASDKEARETILAADKVIAHNSMFEYLIWTAIAHRRYGWPKLPLTSLYDTMAQCAYHALPLALAKAGEVLRLDMQKDPEGHSAMMKLCKPRNPRKKEKADNPNWADPTWWHEDPADIEKVINYCCRDVQSERALFNTLPELPPNERKIWLMDQRINLRGVPVDLDNIRYIVDTVKDRKAARIKDFTKLTKGAVTGPQSYKALREWVNAETGLKVKSVDADSTNALLELPSIPDHVRKVLEIKAELSKASASKLQAMLDRASSDGRVRGLAQYHGSSTGRWAARGVQMHNLPRDSYGESDWEQAVGYIKEDNLDALNMIYDDMYYVASRCVRGAIKASEGKEFICADYSAIEMCGNAYLAGEEAVLEAIRSGKDMYKIAASGIFNSVYELIDKIQRQVGKVSELALGYGGGIGAYASMAKGYNLDLETLIPVIMPTISKDERETANRIARGYLRNNPGAMSLDAAMSCDVIKQRWRNDRPAIVAFWHGLEAAAYQAIRNPGEVFSYRGIKYVSSTGFLKCRLPSGRIMHYFMPKIQNVKRKVRETEGHPKQCMCDECTRWEESITYMGMKQVEGKTTTRWTLVTTYGGKLCENVTQGFCRDLLAEGMLRLEDANYPLHLHVHDEAASEIVKGSGNLEKFCSIMAEAPAWAEGMPISADGWIGQRYRKG